MKTKIRFLLILLLFSIYIFNAYILWVNLIDDAYISLRYARNFADGKGMVYNPGEQVEGYTNFLWVIIEVFIFKLGGDAAAGIQILGFLVGLATWFLILHWSNKWHGSESFLVLVPLAYMSVTGYFIGYSLSGLETNFYGFLMLSGAYFITQKPQPTGAILSTFCFLGASFTRPEGLLFSMLFFLIQGYLVLYRHLKFKILIINLFVFFIPFIIYTYWRVAYFGSILPNTFYVRVGTVFDDYFYTWGQGYRYTVAFLKVQYWMPLISLLAVIKYRKFRGLLVCILFTAAFISIIISEGGDYMVFYRMFVPIIPLMFLLLGVSTEIAAEWAGKLPSRFVYSCLTIIHLVVIMLIWLPWWPVPDQLSSEEGTIMEQMGRKYRDYMRFDFHMNDDIELAGWIREHAPEDMTIAVQLAGGIPYYTGLVTYDCLGVTDANIGRSKLNKTDRKKVPKKGRIKALDTFPGHEKSNWEYIMKRNPDLLILNHVPEPILRREGYGFRKFPGRNRGYWAKHEINWGLKKIPR